MYSDFANIELAELVDITKYKRLSVETAEALRYTTSLVDKADTIHYCGSLLSFDSNGNLVSANFCRERFCPMCQRRKALRTYAEISRLWEVMQAEYSFVHLVLTIKNVNGRELPDTINHLFKCSSKMFKMPRFKQGVKGVLRCLEVSYNADNNTYHPHLHCLCAVRKSYFTSRYYLKHEELREMWAMSIKADYTPQISVKKCDDGAIAEVAKYCVKPLALDLPTDRRARVLDVLNFALKGRRMLQSYGVVRETARALKIDLEGDGEDLPNDGAKSHFCYDYAQNLYTEC